MDDSAREWLPRAQNQYRKVSRENKEEFRREKRVKELAKKGFNHAAISGMMGDMSERNIQNIVKKKGNVELDGRY